MPHTNPMNRAWYIVHDAGVSSDAVLFPAIQRQVATEIERLEAERDAIQETLTTVEREVAIVYRHITNGQISKCNTLASAVIAVADDIASGVNCNFTNLKAKEVGVL